MLKEYEKELKGRKDDLRFIDPENWTHLARKIKWRCCGCGQIHHIQFRVSNNEIYIKAWKK